MEVWTSPDSIYKINIGTNTILRAPEDNILTITQILALYLGLANDAEQVTLGDHLIDVALQNNRVITNIPQNHF